MPTVINGLPAHVLLIHVIVILVPLGALFTALSAVWPAARRKLGFISPLTCLIALVFVPVTTHAGKWLENRIDPQHQNRLIDKHADLGDTFLWYALALFVVSAGVWALGRRFELSLHQSGGGSAGGPPTPGEASGRGGPTSTATATATRTEERARVMTLPQWATILVAVVAVAVSALVTWQLYRVGDAGAHAVWNGVANRN